MSHTIQLQISGLLSLIAFLGIAILLSVSAPQGKSESTYPVQPPLLQADGTPDHDRADWR